MSNFKSPDDSLKEGVPFALAGFLKFCEDAFDALHNKKVTDVSMIFGRELYVFEAQDIVDVRSGAELFVKQMCVKTGRNFLRGGFIEPNPGDTPFSLAQFLCAMRLNTKLKLVGRIGDLVLNMNYLPDFYNPMELLKIAERLRVKKKQDEKLAQQPAEVFVSTKDEEINRFLLSKIGIAIAQALNSENDHRIKLNVNGLELVECGGGEAVTKYWATQEGLTVNGRGEICLGTQDLDLEDFISKLVRISKRKGIEGVPDFFPGIIGVYAESDSIRIDDLKVMISFNGELTPKQMVQKFERDLGLYPELRIITNSRISDIPPVVAISTQSNVSLRKTARFPSPGKGFEN